MLGFNAKEEQRRHDQADALAAPGRRETQDVLWSVVAKVMAAEPAEHDAFRHLELDVGGASDGGGSGGVIVARGDRHGGGTCITTRGRDNNVVG